MSEYSLAIEKGLVQPTKDDAPVADRRSKGPTAHDSDRVEGLGGGDELHPVLIERV